MVVMLLPGFQTNIFFLSVFVTFSRSSLISQSHVSLCERSSAEPTSPDGVPCEKKIVVTMGLKAGQKSGSESLYANIDQIYEEGSTELSRLKKPFKVEIHKSPALISYELYYRGSANAKPHEESTLQRDCRDHWELPVSELACGKFHDGTSYVFNSQGFCCVCSLGGILHLDEGIDNIRGNHSCHLFGGVHASAHCLRFHDLWYDVYEIGPGLLYYNISIDIAEFGGIEEKSPNGFNVIWRPLSSFSVSPEVPIRRSENGKVVAEIHGELLGGTFVKDFSTKYLLIPNIIHWPKDQEPPVQYTNGPSDWLIVDKHDVDLSGRTCNRVGTYFTAFRTQTKPCQQDQGSCLHNQPLDIWNGDNTLRQGGNQGHYMLQYFGDIHESTTAENGSVVLKFKYSDFQNTLVTFHIDASDLTFVYSVASGRIVNVYATNFKALSESGFVYVEVENTGEVSSEFSVSISGCSQGITKTSGKTVHLDPGQVRELTFQIRTYRSLGAAHSCEVQLFDADYALIQSAQVSFSTNGTCFCYGICGCVCNPSEQLLCPEPPVVYVPDDIGKRVLFLILESLGAHGLALIIGGTLIILGFIKLSFGGIFCCRKKKSEELAEELKKKGLLPQQGPMPVICGGKCQGALAAKDRFERRNKKLLKLGKKPKREENWMNSSYACSCHTELTDIRFIMILRSVFFFFYCCFIPFVMLGKKVVWRYRDTAKTKSKAERYVIRKAKQDGTEHKYVLDPSKPPGEEQYNNEWEMCEEGSQNDEWIDEAIQPHSESLKDHKDVQEDLGNCEQADIDALMNLEEGNAKQKSSKIKNSSKQKSTKRNTETRKKSSSLTELKQRLDGAKLRAKEKRKKAKLPKKSEV